MEDLSGREKHCMILIGNLDKMLDPPTIVEFLYSQTEVLPIVYIYPSWSIEIFTRGAIFMTCEKDFQKLCDFLNNPNHIIMSSTGRYEAWFVKFYDFLNNPNHIIYILFGS